MTNYEAGELVEDELGGLLCHEKNCNVITFSDQEEIRLKIRIFLSYRISYMETNLIPL